MMQMKLLLNRTCKKKSIHVGWRNSKAESYDPLSLPSGLITKLSAKRLKEALNGQIQYIGEMSNVWKPDVSPN